MASGRTQARRHTVCAVMTSAFLDFSKSRSNDLSTSVPEYGFPDLKPGDRRCLCAAGWQEALKANQAPRVVDAPGTLVYGYGINPAPPAGP